MRQMGCAAGIRRERAYHRYNSYRGPGGKASQTSSVATSRRMAPGRNWVPMSPSSSSPSVRFTSPGLRLCQQRDRRPPISMPNLAQQQEMLQILMDAKPAGVEPILHFGHGMAVPARNLHQHACRERFHPEHMSRKGNCIDNGATEQALGTIWRRILSRPRLADLRRASKPTSTPTYRTRKSRKTPTSPWA